MFKINKTEEGKNKISLSIDMLLQLCKSCNTDTIKVFECDYVISHDILDGNEYVEVRIFRKGKGRPDKVLSYTRCIDDACNTGWVLTSLYED